PTLASVLRPLSSPPAPGPPPPLLDPRARAELIERPSVEPQRPAERPRTDPPHAPEARPYQPVEHPEIPLPSAMPLPAEGRGRAEPPWVNASDVTTAGQLPTIDPTGGGRRRRRSQPDTAYPLGGRNWATGEQPTAVPPLVPPPGPPGGRRRA